MNVLKITPAVVEVLNGYEKGPHKLEFIQDQNDNWICGLEVLLNPEFKDIHSLLSSMEIIEYRPKESSTGGSP